MKRREFLKILMIDSLSTQSKVLNFNLFIREKLNFVHKIDIRDESTEGGKIKCFVRGDTISKLEIEQFWESGKHFITILLKQNRAFKVNETKIHYNVPFYFDKEMAKEYDSTEYFDEQKSEIIKNVYFFKDGKIINASTSSKQIVSNTEMANMEKVIKSRLDFAYSQISNIANVRQT